MGVVPVGAYLGFGSHCKYSKLKIDDEFTNLGLLTVWLGLLAPLLRVK
jgi:hypothetical protein